MEKLSGIIKSPVLENTDIIYFNVEDEKDIEDLDGGLYQAIIDDFSDGGIVDTSEEATEVTYGYIVDNGKFIDGQDVVEKNELIDKFMEYNLVDFIDLVEKKTGQQQDRNEVEKYLREHFENQIEFQIEEQENFEKYLKAVDNHKYSGIEQAAIFGDELLEEVVDEYLNN